MENTIENEFPLFPELTEAGKQEAVALIEKFKSIFSMEANKIIDSVISNAYCDIIPYINSDSWSNFRNQIMNGYQNYSNKKIQAAYDFKTIRQEIYKEHKADIDKDLNQDNLEKIAALETEIEYLKNEFLTKKYF